VLPAAAIAAAACTFLDDPQQCATDGDCERLSADAVCDLSQAICVPRAGAGADASFEGSTSPDAGSPPDPPLDPSCNVSPKPVANASTGLLPGPDGGAQVGGSLTLGCDKDWTLEGPLVVPANATLTIAAGTTIRAKKGTGAGIIVFPGGKIIAQGQRSAPIVFTVDDPAPVPGDWQGVFVLGNAPRTGTSSYLGDPLLGYGGNNADDDSGILNFVRIEYAGNGLVLGGVGKTTKIDSVQVRMSNDNCFVLNGGAFDAKHLVCQFAADEHFEIGDGYAGRLQFVFSQKAAADGEGHHGLLSDGMNTFPVVYNATLCGQSQGQNVLGYGLVVRNDTKLDGNNMVITGWFSGVDAIGSLGNPLQLRSSIAFGNTRNPVVEDGGAGPIFDAGGNKTTNPNLVDCHDAKDPKPWPNAAVTDGARQPPNDGFFDTAATYIGAFKDANDAWMTGAWVRFDDK
jgi:hypothetical protein